MAVSVIIPAFNASGSIGDAIRSVVAQTAPAAEIIVIDDGSTDDTGNVARGAGGSITLVRQENRGPSAARNKGLELAQGDLVAFLDADDVWRPSKIERQLARIGHGMSGVATSFEIVDDVARPPLACLVEDARLRAHKPLDFVMSPKVLPSTLLIDRRVTGDVAFPEQIVDGEDMVFAALVRTKGPIGAVEEVLVSRHRHAFQLTQQGGHFSRNVQNRLQWIRDNWTLFGADSPESLEREFWDAAAQTVLARLWARDVPGFEAWRRELLEIWPTGRPVPEALLRRAYPPWVYRIKDSIDHLIR